MSGLNDRGEPGEGILPYVTENRTSGPRIALFHSRDEAHASLYQLAKHAISALVPEVGLATLRGMCWNSGLKRPGAFLDVESCVLTSLLGY